MTDEEFEDYLAEALEELRAKQDALRREYGLGAHERFVVDFEEGVLTFFHNEKPLVEAEIIPLATYVPDQNSFKWAWANEQFPADVREEASKAKNLYNTTGFELFRNEFVECDEAMAWELVALACKSQGTMGAYRIPHTSIHSYVLIKSIMQYN